MNRAAAAASGSGFIAIHLPGSAFRGYPDGISGGEYRVKFNPFVCMLLAAALMPSAARADDPDDPEMRNPAARARDRELTRRLNQQELARVRARDARIYATHDNRRTAVSRDHDAALSGYARERAQYEREMARWRRAVAACRAGDYSACD